MIIHPPSLLQMSSYSLQLRKLGSIALFCEPTEVPKLGVLSEDLEFKKGHCEPLSLLFFHAGKDL